MLYKGNFKDIHNNEVLVLIQTDGSSSYVVDLNEDNGDIRITKDNPVIITSELDSTFDTVIKNQCQINLYVKKYMGDHWFTNQVRNTIVNIWKNEECLFAGFLEPNIYTQSFSSTYDMLTLNCTDALATLQYYNFHNIHTIEQYNIEKQSVFNWKFSEILSEIFSTIHHLNLKDDSLSNSVFYDGSIRLSKESRLQTDIFTDVEISELLFLGEEFDDLYNEEEILHEILQFYNLHVRQIGLNFYIFHWDSVKNNKEIKWYPLFNESYYIVKQESYETIKPGQYVEVLKPVINGVFPRTYGASTLEELNGNQLQSELGEVESTYDIDGSLKYVQYYFVTLPNGQRVKTKDYVLADINGFNDYIRVDGSEDDVHYVLKQDDEGNYKLKDEAPDQAFDFDGDFIFLDRTYEVDPNGFYFGDLEINGEPVIPDTPDEPEPEPDEPDVPEIVYYTLTWKIDGQVYKTEQKQAGESITAPDVDYKENYTFAWSSYPSTMPAYDLTVNGVYTYVEPVEPEPDDDYQTLPEGDYVSFSYSQPLTMYNSDNTDEYTDDTLSFRYSLDGNKWYNFNYTAEEPLTVSPNTRVYIAAPASGLTDIVYDEYMSNKPPKRIVVNADTLIEWMDVRGNIAYLFNVSPSNTVTMQGRFQFPIIGNVPLDLYNLSLPYTELIENGYKNCFKGMNINYPPSLPATTLANGCYWGMFNGCENLTVPPELPATTLADSCYRAMFSVCKRIEQSPELPATTLASYCYASMFNGCTSLRVAPELPATTLAEYCYEYMFNSTGLTSTTELKSTNLAHGCYSGMYNGCTSLTYAHDLPATTLPDACYLYMFGNCSKLVNAPVVYGVNVGNQSMFSMFDGCTSLTSLTIYAENMDIWGYYSILNNVTTNGTLYCKENSGVSASRIPSTWTIQYI